jgi:beta-glucosidase
VGGPVVETARHTVMIGRSCTDITATTVLAVNGTSLPPRAGPLPAADRDEESGTRLTAASLMSGDAVEARVPGAWLGFTGVDLGSGPRRVRVTVAAPAGGAGLSLLVGDPLRGQVAATLKVPFTGGVHEFSAAADLWRGPDGIQDLFLVMDTPGTRVGEIAWDAA